MSRAAVRLKIPRGGRGPARGMEMMPIIPARWMGRRESFSTWAKVDGDDEDPKLHQRVGRVTPSTNKKKVHAKAGWGREKKGAGGSNR